jgi:hypothetical protein
VSDRVFEVSDRDFEIRGAIGGLVVSMRAAAKTDRERRAELQELLVTAAAALDKAAPSPALLEPIGFPVRDGRMALGRQRVALGSGAAKLNVVAGFNTAVWLGCPDMDAPALGRLVWRGTATIDGRGRVVLDRRARAYLAVADLASFEVVVLRPANGGLLLVPLDGFEARLEAIGA